MRNLAAKQKKQAHNSDKRKAPPAEEQRKDMEKKQGAVPFQNLLFSAQ